jgi:CheY-like chemotaxis protein
MSTEPIRVYLADDDEDDCSLFQEALTEVNDKIDLVISRDGEELMETLDEKVPPPPLVLFLDLNMPRKSGLECLKEMKQNDKFKNIPVVIFSTSADADYVEKTFGHGANYYARKPGTFIILKKLIEKVMSIDWANEQRPQLFDKFFLHP